ncbi:galactoside O-acetyltransferase [Petrotoga sp. HKA.pet.4.5]|uniref:acyltransferase n=1 Tax=Petrotoga sp. HKA.pet.4.5 TaxID=1473155 RepID=UPI000EF165AC|nr:acyltransferase [Petrotoga sp. HKA.pet.4.5]RLL87045.1 galactoside O-acetyltransferase [Petrotoga sp. HKA.pet.4.5]
MSNSFYSQDELKEIGFKKVGNNVFISKKASIYSPEKIEIGNNVRIDDFCILSGNITLGYYIHIAACSLLYGSDKGIIMEDFTTLSSKVSIYAISDDYSGNSLTNPMIPDKYKKLDKGPVILRKHVIIGSGTVILPNIIIGEGTAVGALSLVNKNLEEWSIYAGNPIKKIKGRSKKLIELEEQFLNEKE